MKPDAPIFNMLKAHAARRPLRLHMPAHKGRLPRAFSPLDASSRLDITELPFSDNLAAPCGVILAAQIKYAALFSAGFAHFLTCGATLGVHALIACSRGDVLVCRNSHLSVFNAIFSQNKTALVLGVTNKNSDENAGFIPRLPNIDEILAAVKQNPTIKTVLLTAPDYYGSHFSDLPRLYSALSALGVLLFLDAAHGAHFGLSPHLPPCPAPFCDAAVLSPHKTLGSLTQTAVLLTNHADLSSRLKAAVNTLHTTSPSYLLLASLDLARAGAERHMRSGAYERLHGRVLRFCTGLSRYLPQITRVETADFCRLVLHFSDAALFDFIHTRLETNDANAEMFDLFGNMVCILSPYDPAYTLPRLLRLLCRAAADFEKKRDINASKTPLIPLQFDSAANIWLNSSGAQFFSAENTELVALSRAENCTFAGVAAGLTPPCMPLLVRGERVTRQIIAVLAAAAPQNLFGVEEGGKIAVLTKNI